MQAYSVVEFYFDNCEEWQTVHSYHLKEKSANKIKQKLEEKYKKENLDSNQHWITVIPIDINED